MKQERLTYEKLREVSRSRQKVKNIIAAGDRQVNVLIAENTSKAKIETNKGEGKIIETQITYTAEALKECQDKIKFTTPKSSLLEYYKYQKIKALDPESDNKIVYGGVDVTHTQ